MSYNQTCLGKMLICSWVICFLMVSLLGKKIIFGIFFARLLNAGLKGTMTQPTVILATASYDHTIRFWEAKSGRCYRTIQYPDSVCP